MVIITPNPKKRKAEVLQARSASKVVQPSQQATMKKPAARRTIKHLDAGPFDRVELTLTKSGRAEINGWIKHVRYHIMALLKTTWGSNWKADATAMKQAIIDKSTTKRQALKLRADWQDANLKKENINTHTYIYVYMYDVCV